MGVAVLPRWAMARRTRPRPGRASIRTRAPQTSWATLKDSALLDLRFKDLGLKLEGTWLQDMTERLKSELAQRGLRFRPHFWLSTEWFSPDGVPGVAIPFYLAHPRLMSLERRQMLEVEGGTRDTCMRILRHETGHAIDTAYRLRRRKKWQQAFGSPAAKYPEHYRPKPHSRKFVLHLDWWYAQSHPLEDFAETFAVWLKPGSRWRSDYEGWPALQKLEYVDELMGEISKQPRRVNNRERTDPVSRNKMTLREHYAKRREFYGVDLGDSYDGHLRDLFTEAPRGSKRTRAAAFLRSHRAEIRGTVSWWTGQHPYTVDQFLQEMIKRCRVLDLRVSGATRQARTDAAVLLTVQVMRGVAGGGYRIAL